MIHALSIYKFSFPFIEYRYEEAIFYETLKDIENLFRYSETYIKTSCEKNATYECQVVYFSGGRCECYLQMTDDYYIPRFQCELYFDDDEGSECIVDIIKIFHTFGLHNYIFDASQKSEKYLMHQDIVTMRVLHENFKTCNESRLKEFLEHTQKKYLSETLKHNNPMRNSFSFMIMSCYNFYINYRASENSLAEIDMLQKGNISREYSGMLELSSQRLKHIHDINIATFKAYSQILDSFFDLLK